MNFKFLLAVFVVAVALMPTAHSNRRRERLWERLTLTGYNYKYYPWPVETRDPWRLIVEVKGDRDANIMFTQCSGCQGLRVLLGGWANQKSFIRDEYRDPNGSYQTLVETPGILSTTEFRRFYITMSWSGTDLTISVKKENEKEAFLKKTWRNAGRLWRIKDWKTSFPFVAFSGYTANPMNFRFKIVQ